MGLFCEKITYLQSAATLLTNNLQVTSNLDFQKNYYALLELKGLRICQLSTLEAGEIFDNMGLRLRFPMLTSIASNPCLNLVHCIF